MICLSGVQLRAASVPNKVERTRRAGTNLHLGVVRVISKRNRKWEGAKGQKKGVKRGRTVSYFNAFYRTFWPSTN